MVKVSLQLVALLEIASGCSLKTDGSTGAVALELSGVPSAVVAGAPVSFTVNAIDTTGAAATDYMGTVSVTASDIAATLPANYTFSAADAGSKTFSNQFTFGSAGQQMLVVTDINNLELVANANVTVGAANKHCVDFGGAPTTVSAGAGMSLTAPIKDLQLNFNEDPVLVYQGATNEGTFVYAKYWASTNWVSYTGTTPAPIAPNVARQGPPCLALDSGDRPSVAFATANLDPNSAANSAVVLLQWSGSAWQGLGGSDSVGLAGPVLAQATPHIALALDSNNVTWAAWDHDSPSPGEVRQRAWNGSAWAAQGNELLAAAAQRPALAIPSSGHAVAAWTDNSNSSANGSAQIVAQQWNGSSWSPLGDAGGVISSSGSSGPITSDRAAIAFVGNGNPVVAWEAANKAGVLNVYVRSWNGVLWAELAGSGTGNGVSGSSGSGAQHPAVAVDADDNTWLAWEDLGSGQIFLRKFSGGTWNDVGGSSTGSGISNATQGAHWPRLHVTGRGVPILSWEEVSGSNYVVHVCPWQ